MRGRCVSQMVRMIVNYKDCCVRLTENKTRSQNLDQLIPYLDDDAMASDASCRGRRGATGSAVGASHH
jgi:hypothetical protein